MRAATVSCVPRVRRIPFERIHISSKGAHFRLGRSRLPACPAFGVCTKSKNGRNVSVGPYHAALPAPPRLDGHLGAKEVYKPEEATGRPPVFGPIIIRSNERAGAVPLATGKRGGRVDRIGHSAT